MGRWGGLLFLVIPKVFKILEILKIVFGFGLGFEGIIAFKFRLFLLSL